MSSSFRKKEIMLQTQYFSNDEIAKNIKVNKNVQFLSKNKIRIIIYFFTIALAVLLLILSANAQFLK